MLQEYSPPSFEIDDINVNTYGILVNWCNFENITITVRQIDELLPYGVSSTDIEKCLHYEIVADIAQQITYNQQGSVPTQTRVRLNLYIFPESVESLTASCAHQGWNQTLNSSSIYYQKNPLISSSFNYGQWRSEYIGSIYTTKIHPYSTLTSHNAVVEAVKAAIEGLYDKYELNPVMTPDVTYWNTPLTKQQGKLTIAVYQNNAVCLEVDTLNSNTPSAAPTTSDINLQNFETGTITYYTNVRTFHLDSQEELQGWRYYNIRTDNISRVVSVTPRDTSVDEGGNLEFDFEVENIADGAQVSWSLTNASDFSTSSGFALVSTTATSSPTFNGPWLVGCTPESILNDSEGWWGCLHLTYAGGTYASSPTTQQGFGNVPTIALSWKPTQASGEHRRVHDLQLNVGTTFAQTTNSNRFSDFLTAMLDAVEDFASRASPLILPFSYGVFGATQKGSYVRVQLADGMDTIPFEKCSVDYGGNDYISAASGLAATWTLWNDAQATNAYGTKIGNLRSIDPMEWFLTSSGDVSKWQVLYFPLIVTSDVGIQQPYVTGSDLPWKKPFNPVYVPKSQPPAGLLKGTGSFTVSPTLDNTTEGVEVFTAEIHYNSVTLASEDVTINDTSLDPPPTYDIAPTAVSVDEGSTATFNITTTNVSDGTVLFWEVSRPEDFSTATGYVTISADAASFTVMPDADSLTEYDSFSGDEDFFVRLRLTDAFGSVVATSRTVIINDTSQESTGASAPTPMVVPPSAPAPVGNAGGGTGSLPKGSGIYHEWFQYTSSSSEPTPTWREHVPDTQSVHIDLQYRPALTPAGDAPAGQQPNELPSDAWNAGPSYYLYARWKDKATNISDLITTSFKIDNGDPYTVIYPVTGNPKVLNAGGHLAPKKVLNDYVYSIDTVTDDHSGVVYYTHTVNGANYHKEVLATSYSQGRAAPNDEYVIDEQITIGSSAGNKTIEIRAYDQAENYKVNSFNVIRSSQSIIWHTLTAQRSTFSPFIVEGHLKVEITNTPELIAGFFATVDLYFSPPDVNFDTSNSTHVIYDIPFAMTVPDMTVTEGIMHIFTNGSPNRAYAQKRFSFTNNTNSATGGIASVAPPIVSIREATSRVYTNTRTNNYGVDAAAGAITPGGSKDRLTAFKITDTASSPGTPPVYNPATLKFEDQAAVGWRMYQDGTETITETESHQFSDPTYGSKIVYVHCCSHAYNGQVAPVPGSAQTFDNNYTITYINDHKGPWLTSANVTEVTGSVTEACSQQGSDWSDTYHNPISLWKRPSVITQDGSITISGTLEDNESEIKRWVAGPFASPPAYSEVNPGLWTVLPTPTPTTSFNYSVTLAPPNSTKTLYVWAVDIVGNVGKHMISIDLNVPAYVSPSLGVTAGTPYKFEGKPTEHKERKSIASMFGDGVYHTGMISNQTPNVQANRVHKLSEYQGLRVYDTANDDNPVFLPSDTLKFSDFRDRQPRISDMNVVPTEPPHDVFSPTEPQFVGDVRKISLTMDIDTGDTVTHHNDNVIDDDASWTATFLPEGGGTTQIISSLNVMNGVILSYTFQNPGTYIFIGTSSFDYKVGKTFQIYKQGTPLPPTQGPPILVDVDLSNDPAGVTPVTIEYKVDQVGIALDAAIAIDRSGSYVSATVDDFAGALADASQTSRKVRLVLLEEGASPGTNSPKSAGDRWSVLAFFENIIYADEKTCLLHAFPNLKYLWDPSGTNTITNMSMHGNTSDFPAVSSLLGSVEVLETGTGPYSELAQSVRDGYDSVDPNSHSWNNSTGKNNRYWYTKAHHADDTLLRALDDFTRSSITNAVDTRWRVSWFPFAGSDASAIGVDHVQGWTTKEQDVVDSINMYKDSPGYHDEPKITAIAELAKGMGLSAAQQPAWRQTAAKLILLFADEEDGGAQNAVGSEAKYKDSSHAEYFIKLLTKPSEEIGFILMDGDRDNSFKDNGTTPYDPNRAVYKLNNMQDAVNLTAKYGGFLGALKVDSDADDISAEVKNAFNNYKAGVKFDIVSAISNPQIMNPNPQASSIHSSGTPVPIPFGNLVAHPNAATLNYHRASFDVELNNAEINTLGVNYIILYVSVKNSSDMEIARREVRIRVV